MTPSEIKNYVGSQSFEKLRSMLSKTWRASAGQTENISDDTVAAAIESEWLARASVAQPGPHTPAPAFPFLPAAPGGWNPTPAPAEQRAFQYYDAYAEHMRSQHEKPHSGFVGVLPQVRISLPERPPADSVLARTAVGTVFTQDHLLPSITAVRAEMMKLDPSFADTTRVDLICPARLGSRFGAIGMYLAYRNHGLVPSFYVLEAGLATGPSVRLFPSRNMGQIVHAPTAYLPTPFVELSNSYDGTLIMTGDQPHMLVVQSYREPRGSVEARIHVTVTYEQRTAATVTKIAPGDLTLMAAERIAAIGQGLGESAIEMQSLLAPAGLTLPWIKKPV